MIYRKKIVYLEWEDPTWTTQRDVFYTPKVFMIQRTAGFLIKKTKEFIRVALNIDEYGEGEFVDIPISLVKKIKWIKI